MSGTKTTWAKVEKGAVVVDPRTGKLKPITKTKTFLQIGNAVPPLLAEMRRRREPLVRHVNAPCIVEPFGIEQ